MKISLLLSSGMVFGAEQSRFKVDTTKKIVSLFGEATLPDGQAGYDGLEKQAWADAVRYVYRNSDQLGAALNFAQPQLKERLPGWVKRLTSRNTVYYRNGTVRVFLEFSFDDQDQPGTEPVAATEAKERKL